MGIEETPDEIVDNRSIVLRILRRAVDVRRPEVDALLLGFVYYFLILSSYYVIRPVRDDIGAANGMDNLPWMFTGTLITMFVANALFSSLVVRYSRRRFIPIAYRFFIFNLLAFFVLMKFSVGSQAWVGIVFFAWTSVFNLFVLSVFWTFMVDLFTSSQSKRLFGFISVGGSLGAIVGAAITSFLVQKIGVLNLLLISAVLLEVSVWIARRFPVPTASSDVATQQTQRNEKPIGGGIWDGILHNLKSPYLLGIAGYMLLYSVTSTFLYFQQVDIAAKAFTDRAARTAFFARIDLVVNILTILAQIFLTGRLLKWLGVGLTLAILPTLSLVGFATLGAVPTMSAFVVFLTLRRAGNFAFARPGRETLFTVLSREDKYKAKNFTDTVMYRSGDQAGAWLTKFMASLGMSGIAFVGVPLCAAWLAVSIWLGKKQSQKTVENSLDAQATPQLSVTTT
jgi:AAA family ATP:ADP antiporter